MESFYVLKLLLSQLRWRVHVTIFNAHCNLEFVLHLIHVLCNGQTIGLLSISGTNSIECE